MKALKILFADDDLKYSMLLKRFLDLKASVNQLHQR